MPASTVTASSATILLPRSKPRHHTIWCCQKALHSSGMATRYPRMGIARDPELQRALANTRPLLSQKETRSAAAQVRALALRGAETLMAQAGPAGALRQRLATKYDVIPAHIDPRTIGIPRGEVDPEDPTPASDALRWVRGE